MPKAGKYDYPFFDLDACIEKLEQYYKVVQTDETSRQLVAETLDMSVTGGGFVNLISSMEKYGLIETGKKNVTLTELGKSILFGEASEKERTKKKAVSRIDLFREILEQFGANATPEQIRAFLRQKGNVDISRVQKMAENVDTIYKKVANYIIPAQKLGPTSQETDFGVSRFGRRDTDTQSEEKVDLLKIQYGSLYIEVPKEDAETALRLVAQKLGVKLEQENQKK